MKDVYFYSGYCVLEDGRKIDFDGLEKLKDFQDPRELYRDLKTRSLGATCGDVKIQSVHLTAFNPI